MGVLRGKAHSPHGRQPTDQEQPTDQGQSTDQGRPSVYYDIDRVLELLQHYCPEVLQDLSGLDSLQTFRGTVVGAATPEPIAALEVGRPWGGATQAEDGETPKLCVWDKGGYHSNAPDLAPYTYRRPSAEALSERAMIDANGFDAIGIFAEFRECINPRRNPRLDDAYVVALFQFIMMLRNNRRYYYYGDRHQDDPKEHLKDIIGALRVVTSRSRVARSGIPQFISGPAVQPPPAQVVMQPYHNPYAAQPYQSPHQQSYQQASRIPLRPLLPARPQPPHQPPSGLP